MICRSFFSRWKDKLAFDYGGRYFGAVLAEVLAHDPRLTGILFPGLSGKGPSNCEPTCEWSFPGTERKRRADLALLSTSSREPLALVEIKYEDEKGDKNPAQIDDYLRYSRKHKIPVLYLTKSPPPAEDCRRIRRSPLAKDLLWAELYRGLTAIKKPHALTTMLCEYLREEVPMWNEHIDKKTLTILVKNCCGLRDDSGHGLRTDRETMLKASQLLNTLVQNMVALNDKFLERIGRRRWSLTRQAEINFYANQDHDSTELQKAVTQAVNQNDSEWFSTGRWQTYKHSGGSLQITSRWTFNVTAAKEKHTRRLPLGLFMYIGLDVGEPVAAELGFWLGGTKPDFVESEPVPLTKRGGYTLEAALNVVVKCARKVLKEARQKGRADKDSMTRDQYRKICKLSDKLKEVKLAAV